MEYLVLPFLVIGFGVMLAPFMSRSWPVWLERFVMFCAQMGNGIWVAGCALVILISIGIPPPFAVVVSLPIMFFAGQYFARLSDNWDAESKRIKRQAWEEHEQREKEKRSDR